MSLNNKSVQNNIALLAAIGITLVGLYAYRLIPERHLVLAPADPDSFSIYSSRLTDGKPAGVWLDHQQLAFRCSYPPGFNDSEYYCSINRPFQYTNNAYTPDKGIDLSRYQHLKLQLSYKGTAPKLRFFARTFDPRFSDIKDPNSTKYNAIFLPATDLHRPVDIPLSSFTVTEWWLLLYKIPRKFSQPDLTNVVNLGIDFSYPMTTGNHDVVVQRIEFTGEWVSEQTWYLGWLGIWLLGVFSHALLQLRQLRVSAQKDSEIIDKLSTDNSRLKDESSLFRRLSTVDPLTQLYNRFGIDQIVASILHTREQHPVKSAKSMSILLIDIDFFKKINDTYGHDAGDSVLRGIADILQSESATSAYVGRWGGEEFIVLTPNQSLAEATKAAEIIRHKIEMAHIPLTPRQYTRVTISIGVGVCTNGDFPTAFKAVDSALYQSKNEGRNRISSIPVDTPEQD